MIDRRIPPCRFVAQAAFLAALLGCAWSTGCVQRRLTIRSNPPGALVRIDNHDIGITPCSTDYIYYGKRHIQLVRDGYQTIDDMRWIWPPWYEIPPLDLVSENVVPYELRDERTINYQMLPQQVGSTQQLLGRAENLRQSTRLEGLAVQPAAPAGLLSVPPVQQTPLPGSYPAAPAPSTAPRSYPLPSPNAAPTPAIPPYSNVNPPRYSPPGGFPPQPGLLPPSGPR